MSWRILGLSGIAPTNLFNSVVDAYRCLAGPFPLYAQILSLTKQYQQEPSSAVSLPTFSSNILLFAAYFIELCCLDVLDSNKSIVVLVLNWLGSWI